MQMFGLDVGELISGLVIGFVVTTFSMWIVAGYLLSIPGIHFKACVKTAVMMQIVLGVMSALSFLFAYIPFGGIVWIICVIIALKATIEGALDVPSGGGTILVLFIVVQLTTFYLIHQVG